MDQEERELWQRCRNGDGTARQILIERFKHLVVITVSKMGVAPGAVIDGEDAISEGHVGLIKAVDRFDPDRGMKFQNYALPWIRKAIWEAFRRLGWVERDTYRLGQEAIQTKDRLEAKLGRVVDDEEVAAELGVPAARVNQAKQAVLRSTMLSLDELANPENESATLQEIIEHPTSPDPAEVVVNKLTQSTLDDRIVKAVGSLPENQQRVLALYYLGGLTMQAIADQIGLRSRQRVKQILDQALSNLRATLHR